MQQETLWAEYLIWTFFGFILIYLGYVTVTHVRMLKAHRIRSSLCRGTDYDRYLRHLPEVGDMAGNLRHWNKWTVYGWMKWVDDKRGRGQVLT